MSVLHQSVLTVLRTAGEEGASESEMAQAGGMWWRKRVGELQRDYAIGWDQVDGEVRYFLVGSVERADDDRDAPPSVPVVVGLLNTEPDLTLFPVRGRSVSHYDLDEAA